MKKILFLLLLVLMVTLFSCVIGTGTRMNNDLKSISMPHYNFDFSSNPEILNALSKGWFVDTAGSDNEIIFVNRKSGSNVMKMRFQIEVITIDSLKQMPVEAFAALYRKMEIKYMVEEGSAKGLYKIAKQIRLDKKQINNKTFYTMKYFTYSKSRQSYQHLYLFFPKQTQNHYFLIGHYNESTNFKGYDENPKLASLDLFERMLSIVNCTK